MDELRKNILLFTAFFFLCSLLHAEPSEAPASSANGEVDVFQVVAPEKSLLTSPQFIVIDDFNSGKFMNRRGATWRTKAPASGALDIGLEEVDARNEKRGYSLRASFHLMPGEEAYFESFLNRLDVSQAKYLVFRRKLALENAKVFKGKIQMELRDWKHESASADITKHLNGNGRLQEWQDVILPMTMFETLDLDQLLSIRFVLNSDDEKLRGKLWIDEVAFFGFNDLAFESHRDNLTGFPKVVFENERRQKLLSISNDKRLLKEIAKDTWEYFKNAKDTQTHLVVDHIRLGEAPLAADYTSPTNIAMDFLAIISAMDLKFIDKNEARARTRDVLTTLKKMRRFKGFFYNFYDTKRLGITRKYISSVDSGWLALSLVIVRQAFGGDIAETATELLDSFDFEEFLDHENNQLVVGFDVPVKDFGGYHYGILATEARATSLYAIGKGDLSKEHWWFLYRTPPEVWRWQNQVPKGEMKIEDGIDYFQGYYEYGGKKIVPSWGGSLFEFLMPTLVIDEKKYAKKGLGLNDRIATELHRDYALVEKEYPVWGISPAGTSNGRNWRYSEFGIKAISVKGYPDRKIVTPHVTFLALDTLPKDAIQNIRRFLEFEIYGEYGFFDSLNLRNEKANPQYLALDQGMILAALCNYLKGGAIKKRFHRDFVGKNIKDLLMKESFFSE